MRTRVPAADVWTARHQWQRPEEARLDELRRGMARVERERFALHLRENQRRRRWVAGLLFGFFSCGEYCIRWPPFAKYGE